MREREREGERERDRDIGSELLKKRENDHENRGEGRERVEDCSLDSLCILNCV